MLHIVLSVFTTPSKIYCVGGGKSQGLGFEPGPEPDMFVVVSADGREDPGASVRERVADEADSAEQLPRERDGQGAGRPGVWSRGHGL